MYLSCATPLSPAMHTQLRHKITFRLYMIYCPQPHLPKLYKSIAAHISCVCNAPYLCLSCVTLLIAKHTALLSLYPTPPPTTPPPCLTKLSPNTANTLAVSHDLTAQKTAIQTRTTLPLPFTFILCLSYAFLVFMLCHGIQFHLLQLNRYVANHISCVYLVLIMYLPCAYPVSLSVCKVIYQKYSI